MEERLEDVIRRRLVEAVDGLVPPVPKILRERRRLHDNRIFVPPGEKEVKRSIVKTRLQSCLKKRTWKVSLDIYTPPFDQGKKTNLLFCVGKPQFTQ